MRKKLENDKSEHFDCYDRVTNQITELQQNEITST